MPTQKPRFDKVPDPLLLLPASVAQAAVIPSALTGLGGGVGYGFGALATAAFPVLSFLTAPLAAAAAIGGLVYAGQVPNVQDSIGNIVYVRQQRQAYIAMYGPEQYDTDLSNQREQNRLLNEVVTGITTHLTGKGVDFSTSTADGEHNLEQLNGVARAIVAKNTDLIKINNRELHGISLESFIIGLSTPLLNSECLLGNGITRGDARTTGADAYTVATSILRNYPFIGTPAPIQNQPAQENATHILTLPTYQPQGQGQAPNGLDVTPRSSFDDHTEHYYGASPIDYGPNPKIPPEDNQVTSSYNYAQHIVQHTPIPIPSTDDRTYSITSSDRSENIIDTYLNLYNGNERSASPSSYSVDTGKMSLGSSYDGSSDDYSASSRSRSSYADSVRATNGSVNSTSSLASTHSRQSSLTSSHADSIRSGGPSPIGRS
jgi:hypothetical protein